MFLPFFSLPRKANAPASGSPGFRVHFWIMVAGGSPGFRVLTHSSSAPLMRFANAPAVRSTGFWVLRWFHLLLLFSLHVPSCFVGNSSFITIPLHLLFFSWGFTNHHLPYCFLEEETCYLQATSSRTQGLTNLESLLPSHGCPDPPPQRLLISASLPCRLF